LILFLRKLLVGCVQCGLVQKANEAASFGVAKALGTRLVLKVDTALT